MLEGIISTFVDLSRGDLWPGFDPTRIPLAISDGKRTLLFRHPVPPAGFRPHPSAPELYVFEGLHPVVRANTAVEWGGALTATLLVSGVRSPREWAALAIHEAFHVFQRERHPSWWANEAELLEYPLEDEEILLLRRLETLALREALSARDPKERAAAAMEFRARRFSLMPAGAISYERGIELVEGLAQYVEAAALGSHVNPLSAVEDAPVEEIRRSFYATGHAIALILERAYPRWKEDLEVERFPSLDELLCRIVAGISPRFPTADEIRRAQHWAQGKYREIRSGRERLKEAFLRRQGWKLVVESEDPLWPRGFDPMNLVKLSSTEVLHRRWVKLGNEKGELECLGVDCLTVAAGDHPLFRGIRRALITGIPEEPEIPAAHGSVRWDAHGIRFDFADARVQKEKGIVRIEVA